MTLPPLGESHWTGDFTTTVPSHLTPELAELLGYFMGDGSLHSKGIRLCVAAHDFDVLQRLQQLGKQLFNLEAHLVEQTGYTEVAFHSVRLAMWWQASRLLQVRPFRESRRQGLSPAHTRRFARF